jgi:hypothetical protein
LSDTFPIKNNQKHGDASLSLVLYFALEYTIRKILENQVGFKLNGLINFWAMLMMFIGG